MGSFPRLFHKKGPRQGISLILLTFSLLFLITACSNRRGDARVGDDQNEDTTSPVLKSASISMEGNQILLTFSQSVGKTKESFGAFTLEGDASHPSVKSLSIDSSNQRLVTLTLNGTVTSQIHDVTLAYNAKKGGITDLAGNALGDFSGKAVKDPRPFILTFLIAEDNLDLTIPVGADHEGKNYDINWGDGKWETITNGGDAGPHTYSKAGKYQVRFSDGFTQIRLGNHSSTPLSAALQLQSIDQWGKASWQSMALAFKDTSHMVLKARDTPNLTRAEDLNNAFSEATSFVNGISQWDVTNVKDISNMFTGAVLFNCNVGKWDVVNITNMDSTFLGADSFHRDLNKWNVAKVTNMNRMFESADSFNGQLSSWNVENVTNMTDMFKDAEAFNQDLGSWYITLNKTTLSLGNTADSITVAAKNTILTEHLDDSAPYTLISVNGDAYDAGSSDFSFAGTKLTYTGTTTGEYVLKFGGKEAARNSFYGNSRTAQFTISITN